MVAAAQVFPGVHCVLYAMFDETERLDRAAMAAQVAYVRAQGADGITVLGLATEVAKLSFEERADMINWARPTRQVCLFPSPSPATRSQSNWR